MFYVIKLKNHGKFLAVDHETNKHKLFTEDEIEGIYVKEKPYRVLNFKTVEDALNFIKEFKSKKINKNHLTVEGRHESQNPYSIKYGNRTPYEFLSSGEKLVVGLIYELYNEWTNGYGLKNSMFTDFVSQCLRDKNKGFRQYANYMYMCDYREELKMKDNQSTLICDIKEIDSIAEKRRETENVSKSTFFNFLSR